MIKLVFKDKTGKMSKEDQKRMQEGMEKAINEVRELIIKEKKMA